jgi:DNA repair photolyase
MRVHTATLQVGISRTPEFEKKRLASFAVNVGTKCGHGCLYCSTGSILRMHKSFKQAGESPFGTGYAIVDPDTPHRVARDAQRIRRRGLVQISTTVDAYSPESQRYNLGRRCLEAVLSQPGWTVRILTKNAAVARDFDLIERYRERVLIGLSITATPDKNNLMSIVEPNASSTTDRMAVLREAHERGLRTYGMFCPLLPGIADSPGQVCELVRFAVECGAEEVFVEPVNPRGPGLRLTQEALECRGYLEEAAAVESVRHREGHSRYVVGLIGATQAAVRKLYDIRRLRFLLYASGLTPQDVDQVRRDSAGVIWLGKNIEA